MSASVVHSYNDKYTEGYPPQRYENRGRKGRYYGGCEYVDIFEDKAIEYACKLFGAKYANVQPHSGSSANMAVYRALLNAGDTVLGMNLGHGGHLTHGAPVTQSAHIYNFINYGTNLETGDLDYDEIERLAKEHQPKILLVGYSAFMKVPDFERIANAFEFPYRKCKNNSELKESISWLLKQKSYCIL